MKVSDFIANVDDEKKRKDSETLLALLEEVTGHSAKMWGPSIVGFGKYHYKYESGREGDSPLVGFSPRKRAISVYIMAGFSQYDELMKKLGKHKVGKSCLYINKLTDINLDILKELVQLSVKHVSEKYSDE